MSNTSAHILDEAIIQQIQEWMNAKSTEELFALAQEAESRPDAFSAEVLEATKRILARRGVISHTTIEGDYREEPVNNLKFNGQIKQSSISIRLMNYFERSYEVTSSAPTKSVMLRTLLLTMKPLHGNHG